MRSVEAIAMRGLTRERYHRARSAYHAAPMDAFEALGAAIEAAWLSADYDELRFPAIAARVLHETRIHEAVSADDVLRWAVSAPRLPKQDDIEASFGEPPITVYAGVRFRIDVLFWLTASTSIHRHGFTGAFQVLHGGSLHSRYAFTARRRICAQMLIGDARILGAELLRRGDVVAIERELTHCLFHLEAPSATVVVRTRGEAEGSPQYEYRPPSLAIDPFYREPTQKRRLQALELLLRAGRADHDEVAAGLIEGSDLTTAYLVLRQAYRAIDDRARVEKLLAVAARRHGAVIEEIATVLREELRRWAIHRLRVDVRDPDRRFFLALAQNLPDRESSYELIRARHPEAEPRERVLAWARELSGVDRIGIDLEDDLNVVLFGALLDGCSEGEMLDRLREEFDPAEVDAQVEGIRGQVARMRKTVLAPLFVGR